MELKDWYFNKHKEHVIAAGNVYNSSIFPDGIKIHTSPITSLNFNLRDKCLEIITHSGSNYKAVFAEISDEPEHIKITSNSLKVLKASGDFMDEALFLKERSEQEFRETLDKELLNGDFYIEITETAIRKAYFKYDKVYKVNSYCHVGMFQNSYLYCIGGIIDFRHYEFNFDGFSTYHISDTIKRLVVKNVHTAPLQIDGIFYPAGQTTITCLTE